jgi:quercetin dioxygenase-like cupin family protein
VTAPEERLRPHPRTRDTGPAVLLELPERARELRREPFPAKDGHRQIGLIHRGKLRLVLFAFDRGGRLPEHKAPGHVVIQCVRGQLAVTASEIRHRLESGEAIVLDPDVSHDVEALVESDMLLTVCLA